jgi:hypothetical protein
MLTKWAPRGSVNVSKNNNRHLAPAIVPGFPLQIVK